MAPRKRTRVLQNTCKQVSAATPVLQNNAKDRSVLVDKTNQIVTVRALRNRKVYRDQNVTVSKKLFNNGVIQSPRATSKKKTSTKQLSVPRKSSECFVALEKVNEVNDHKKLVCKSRSSPSAEKQNLTKKVRKVVRKGKECPVVPENANKTKVNKDISPPNVNKQTTTKRLGNVPQESSKCSVALESNVTEKDQKKLVYKDISPPSAEKQKTCTPKKKIMLYDFKGGSGSDSNSARRPTRKRKAARKRVKPQSGTSDEENCDSQNVSKKMKMLASYSQENKKDCTNVYSQSLQQSVNSSVQPLREQNTVSNLSVKSETRKFFKTPMRKQLVEMALFNYSNQKKNKFPKSSRTVSRRKENSKSNRSKQNLLLLKSTQNSFDTRKKLPVKPVVLNGNSMHSEMCNVATVGNCNIPVLKPTTSSSKIPVLVKPTTSNNKPMLVTTTTSNNKPVLVTTITSNNKPVLITTTSNNKPPVLVTTTIGNNKPVLITTTSNNKPVLVTTTTTKIEPPVQVKHTTSSAVVSTKLGLEKVDPETVIADATQTVEVMDVDVSAARYPKAEETNNRVAVSASRVNCKRGGANFTLNFTLGESGPECSKQSDKSATMNQAQTSLPARSIIPATAAPPPVAVPKQMRVERDKTEKNYFIGPVRSFQFLEKYSRSTRRHQVGAVYVAAAPSMEHFTLDNCFGFDEELEDELTLSPVKRPSDPNITGPPLTSTPHIATTKSVLPQHNRLTVKPKVKEYQRKGNASISANQNNCSQILARGGCGFKSSTLSSTKRATFAVPHIWNIPASSAKSKQAFVGGAGSSMVQASITDYMQNNKEVSSVSDIPFDTSLSNIEADELSISRAQPPRRSYERPVRNRRRVERDDYVSEEEEEEPQTKTFSRKHSESKRLKRSKKQERMFEKWASNVSSQFEEIDSIALIVE